MKQSRNSIGIIDEDPTGGKYPQLLNYPVSLTQHRLRLRTNTEIDTRVIIEIPSNLELWLQDMAGDLSVDLQNYGILNRTGKLKKRYEGDDIRKYHQFLGDIQNHLSFQQLKRWLEQFRQ